MSLLKKFEKYLDIYDPILKKGSGLTTAELKSLVSFEMITLTKIPLKSGKSPKNENAFQITDSGRSYFQMKLNKKVPVTGLIQRTKKKLDETNAQVIEMKGRLSGLEKELLELKEALLKVVKLEDKGETLSSHSIKKHLSDREVLQILREAQSTSQPKERSGMLYSVEIYFSALNKANFEDDNINQKLYNLYENNLLELQMGPANNRSRGVVSPSGKTFHWGWVKE